jgi:hypothetical protein
LPTQNKITYNKIKPTTNATVTEQAIANASNTVSRPGPLTTEWWTVLVATAVSAVLGVVGIKGSAGAQVATIVAPIVLALAYAFVRAHTKGALADALRAVFPQATTSPPGGPEQNGADASGSDQQLAGAAK